MIDRIEKMEENSGDVEEDGKEDGKEDIANKRRRHLTLASKNQWFQSVGQIK